MRAALRLFVAAKAGSMNRSYAVRSPVTVQRTKPSSCLRRWHTRQLSPLMAWPRVFALDLGTCFASLLDHEVGGMTLDHGFDARSFVAGYDDEACAVRCDAVVLPGGSSIVSRQASVAHSQWN